MLSKRMQVTSVERDRSFDSSVSSILPKERQRFTPWLEDQINQGDINGLVFSEFPGCGWTNRSSSLKLMQKLFKRWAQHTGKYRQGDQPDPSTWKTRFHCALRKMQEIVEIKELRNLEGSKPYRVFKIKTKLEDRQDEDDYQPDMSTWLQDEITRLQEMDEIKELRRSSRRPARIDRPVQLGPVSQVQPCCSRRFSRMRCMNEERGSSPLGLRDEKVSYLQIKCFSQCVH